MNETPAKVNVPLTTMLGGYSTVTFLHAFTMNPMNISLMACHGVNVGMQIGQIGRWLAFDGTESDAGMEMARPYWESEAHQLLSNEKYRNPAEN